MSGQYDNTNQGVLFKNDKEGNDKRPDYKGTINVNGADFWLSAWIKSGKAGNKYMSLSVKAKDAGDTTAIPASARAGKAVPSMPADFDDKLPFR